MQINKKPITLLKTTVPDVPIFCAQKFADRIINQQTMQQKMMAKVIMKNVPACSCIVGNSAISVEKPINTAMVPGPEIIGMAIGKNA